MHPYVYIRDGFAFSEYLTTQFDIPGTGHHGSHTVQENTHVQRRANSTIPWSDSAYLRKSHAARNGEVLRGSRGGDRYIYIYLYVCMHVCEYTCIYVSICICIHEYLYIYIHIYTYKGAFMYVYICICLYLCIHMYIYVSVCIHIYVYMYICIQCKKF